MKRSLLALLLSLFALTSLGAAAEAKTQKSKTTKKVFTASNGPVLTKQGAPVKAEDVKRERKVSRQIKATDDPGPVIVPTPGPIPVGSPVERQLKRAGSVRFDVRFLPQVKPLQQERKEYEPPDHTPVTVQSNTVLPPDVSKPALPTASIPAPAPISVFEGLDRFNFGAGSPPDTNGDAGPNDYIQTVNTSIGIFNKSTGAQKAAFSFNTFMAQGNFGNLCDTNNFGDPVVLYDTFEDRWIITDFAFLVDGGGNPLAPAYQCFAASMSGDPVAGGWNFYSIQLTDALNDYPKFGIWPDGLYMSSNLFTFGTGSFQAVRVWAFNKAQMYAGSATVKVATFDVGGGDFTIIPSNARLQTGTPPVGRPNFFMSTSLFLNAVNVYKFHVDWNSISLSTFTGPDTPIAATSWFSPNSSPALTGAPQPGTTQTLDILATRAMMQNQYTNFGGTESLWVAHTVRRASAASGGSAAPRWYQVNINGGTVNLAIPQASTWDPDGNNTIHRFIPSVALNRAGDLAMGYSTSSATTEFPSIKYAGRLAGDPVNTFSLTEQTFFTGTASQTGINRWGDYSAMTLDPDGCTFWFTTEYANPADQTFNHRWLTKFGSFRYPSCVSVGAGGTVTGTVTATAGGAPISGATIQLGARTTTTNGSGVYSFLNIPAGTYPSIIASKPGFITASASNIVVTDGGTATQDFSLAAAAPSGCLTDTTQADFQTGVPANTDLTATPGSALLLKPDVLNTQNTSTTNSGFGFNSTNWVGQTFQPTISGPLTKVELDLFCSGCTGTFPNLTVSIRATSGDLPTGADLATATMTGFNSGAGGYFPAVFASPLTVTAGTRYAVLVRPTSNPSAGIYAYVVSSANPYANGRWVLSGNSGASWSAGTTGSPATERDLGFKTYINTGYTPSGTFVSSPKDSNPAGALTPIWSTLSWNATVPASTALKFQVAGSNSPGGPFNFIGPDGTAATFFTTAPAPLSQFYGLRYLEYKAFFTSSDITQTPSLDDVTVCFTNVDCTAPISITPTPTATCANSTGNTASGPAGETSYAWSITNGTITSATNIQTITYTAGASGTVGLLLNVVEPGGCRKSASTNVTINPLPTTPTISGTLAFCAGSNTTLTSDSASGNQWYLNGGIMNGETNQNLVVTAAGSYTVQVTDGNGCVSAMSAPAVVSQNNPPPVPTIAGTTNGTGTQDQACPEVPLTLTATSAGATSFQWYKDIDLLPGETNATYQATGAATYFVTATVNGCTSAKSAGYVVQNPTPHSPFISFRGQDSSVTTLNICQGGSQIIDSDSATGIQWYKDGVAIAVNGNSQSYTATGLAPGTYVFTAQLNALGCHSQFGRNVTLIVDAMPPTPTISGDTNGTGTQDQACPEQPLTLHANGATGATSYTWYSDNAVIPNETSSTLIMTGVGNISVTATNGTCTTAHSATYVVQNPTPHAPFITIRTQASTVTSISICQGSSVILDSDSATGIQWWKDGSPIAGPQSQSLTVSGLPPGTFTYTAQLNALGCHSQFGRNITITVNPTPSTPTITPGGPTTFCQGGGVTLTSSSASGNQWNLNGNPIGGSTGNSFSATASGSYTVTVSNGFNCSATSAPTTVTVNPLPATPTITPGGPTTFCAGGSVTLTSNSASGNQWFLNGNPIGGATNQTFPATATGSYTVQVTDGNACTSASSNAVSVTVNPTPATPTNTPGGPTTFCAGGSVTLTSSSASGNQWFLNGNPIGGATNQTYPATATGSYTVQVTNGNACTSASSNAVSVTVNPIPATPTITPGGPTTFCAGGSVTLTSSAASGNQWFLNGNPIGGATNTTFPATASGSYTVKTTDVNSCTSAASAATVVTVNAKPDATITAPASVTTSSTGNVASVANAGAGATYAWSITNGTITGGNNTPSITFTAGAAPPGTLTINVTVTTAASCSDTKSANVNRVLPVVTVTSVSPNFGTVTGGTSVTINGTNFAAGATVTFGGTAATNVVVVSAIKITAKTPAHAAGAVNVTVTNADTSTGTLTNGYSYQAQVFDPNGDGVIDPADIFFLINYLFLGGPPPHGPAGVLSGDANGDGVVDPADIFYLVNFLFLGGQKPNFHDASIHGNPGAMAIGNAGPEIAGSVTLGAPVLRAGHYFIPVVMTSRGSAAPQSMSLKLHVGGDAAIGDVVIRRAGAAKDVPTVFETSRRSGNDVAYLVAYDPRGISFDESRSAVVAEIEIAGAGANLSVSIDPALTMLSNQAGTSKATVANGNLEVRGTAARGDSSPRPRTPGHEVN